jgi:hypothetical protein
MRIITYLPVGKIPDGHPAVPEIKSVKSGRGCTRPYLKFRTVSNQTKLKTCAKAVGAIAVGALAVGSVALGAIAIGALAIGRARIRKLQVDELVVGKLTVIHDRDQTPP